MLIPARSNTYYTIH